MEEDRAQETPPVAAISPSIQNLIVAREEVRQRRQDNRSNRGRRRIRATLDDPEECRRRNSAAHSKALVKAWIGAQNVTPMDVARHVPTDTELRVGEAILAGQFTMQGLSDYTGLLRDEVRLVLANPVAMAYLSKAIYQHFQLRVCLVDSALYRQAMTGDTSAIKLFYDRMRLASEHTLNVNHTHSVDLSALSYDDLKRLVRDGKSALPGPLQQIIDAEFTNAADPPAGAGNPVCSPDGAAETDAGSSTLVLPGPDAGPPEAAPLSRGGSQVP